MMSPLVPREWKWAGLRRLPYRGREVAFFAGYQPDGPHVYATTDFDAAPETPNAASATKHLYDEDVTHQVDSRNPLAHHIAFKRAGETLVCLGSSAEQTMLLPLRLHDLLDDNTIYQAEIYSSAWHRWTTGRRAHGKDMEEAAVQIEAGGYRLFRFLEQPA